MWCWVAFQILQIVVSHSLSSFCRKWITSRSIHLSFLAESRWASSCAFPDNHDVCRVLGLQASQSGLWIGQLLSLWGYEHEDSLEMDGLLNEEATLGQLPLLQSHRGRSSIPFGLKRMRAAKSWHLCKACFSPTPHLNHSVWSWASDARRRLRSFSRPAL